MPRSLNPILHEAFSALNEVGVRWVLLRASDDLLAPDGDVDLLVAQSDLATMTRILLDQGFVRPRWSKQSDEFIRYGKVTNTWIWLDVCTELAFTHLRTSAESLLLGRRQRFGEVWLPSDDDWFWTLVLRAALDRGGRSAAYRRLLGPLSHRATSDGPIAAIVLRILPGAIELPRHARAADWAAMDSALREFLVRARANGIGRSVPGINHVRRLSARVRRTRGIGVALIGIDGTGKSTLATALAASVVLPSRIVYMGVWNAPPLFRLLRGPGRVGYAVSAQWLRWLIGAYHRYRGRLVIFDRYSEEHLVPAPRADLLGRSLQAVRRLAACPAPDLALLLEAPGEVAYQRKGERSPSELDVIQTRFRQLTALWPEVVVLDASVPAHELQRHAAAAIWDRYSKHLKG